MSHFSCQESTTWIVAPKVNSTSPCLTIFSSDSIKSYQKSIYHTLSNPPVPIEQLRFIKTTCHLPQTPTPWICNEEPL